MPINCAARYKPYYGGERLNIDAARLDRWFIGTCGVQFHPLETPATFSSTHDATDARIISAASTSRSGHSFEQIHNQL